MAKEQVYKDMKTNNQYTQPKTTIVDLYGEEMMQDFVPYSETEVVDLPIDTDADDGIRPEDALGKEGSIWDE